MTVAVSGESITFNDNSVQATAPTGFGFKSRLINGGMTIDQRNAGASVTATNGGYTLDRWFTYSNQASKFSVQQNAGSVTPPAGFRSYLGITSLSAYSVLAGDYFTLIQNIEGFNTADFAFGTASASSVTLSFWVRSSLTGTFGGSLENGVANRTYPFTYAISAANTWEQKSITIAGETSGTWYTTNGIGIRVQFGLGVGSSNSGTAGAWVAGDFLSATGAVSVVGTSGATFYITGVQLEKGSTATSFDCRPYGTELGLCQRYYEVLYATNSGSQLVGTQRSGVSFWANWFFTTDKRSSPTVSLMSAGSWPEATPTIYPGTTSAQFAAGSQFYLGGAGGSAVLQASAEL